MQGWGPRGRGVKGNGGRAQRTAEPAGNGQLRRSLPRLISASPLPSSPGSEQHPLQTLDPHSLGRPSPAAPCNYLASLANPGTLSASSWE